MKSIVAALLVSVIASQAHADDFLFCQWSDAKHVYGMQPGSWAFDGDQLRQMGTAYKINRDSVLATLQVMVRTEDRLELQWSGNPTALPRYVIDLRTEWATRPNFADDTITDHGLCALVHHALDGSSIE